tara:strand:+ start:433 stop:648 length:216 start_codon:yes stop_codon:yes gene_type:complete
MLDNYGKKDIRKSTVVKADPVKPAASKKDGDIYENDGMWVFNWKGSVCGYLTKEQAEIGLKKVSGTFEAKS